MRTTDTGHCVRETGDPEVLYCGDVAEEIPAGDEFDPGSCYVAVSDYLYAHTLATKALALLVHFGVTALHEEYVEIQNLLYALREGPPR